MLRKYVPSPEHIWLIEDMVVDNKLTYEERPEKIVDRKDQEADEYGSYGYAASPSLGEAARSIPKPLMPPLPTETHSTGAIAASSILCFPTR
ncbi:unnamed protein product [Vicia faba]|uniref:Uncharacterized protein n=1 Tax=Vicia faba TaxID=3906 RepID=A0AAV0ZWP8_VICFA|nr:unnamed protein product [Vicia faba]CAI8601638.1 unnamed protein product [Vicia faba]CAI8604876.1 unnamed protein product [Vicia faba]CAI8608486.1 unnamed protein product [Vicia faba]